MGVGSFVRCMMFTKVVGAVSCARFIDVLVCIASEHMT
jgi:hypothetical protein